MPNYMDCAWEGVLCMGEGGLCMGGGDCAWGRAGGGGGGGVVRCAWRRGGGHELDQHPINPQHHLPWKGVLRIA